MATTVIEKPETATACSVVAPSPAPIIAPVTGGIRPIAATAPAPHESFRNVEPVSEEALLRRRCHSIRLRAPGA